ncbi:Voltage-dependent calcium channel gamma-8 subunit [Orchesella cincta]|uniref:Voltage-dependent calcium channel gamma-8 subunit n=1 Tax=Orchesella cincta TaxID=48709 RepID=A0A1D2MHA7_ORCCI|nr:Voltage-dependent calcium channel gamma-8 subunit [Orchesella cincta]
MARSRSNTPPKKSTQVNRVVFSPSSTRNSDNGSINSSTHPKLQSKESADNEKRRRVEKVARAKERREAMLKRVRMEKKVMLFSSIVAFLSLFPVWIMAVFTDHWFNVRQSDEALQKAFNVSLSEQDVFIYSNAGLWRMCHHFQTAGRSRQTCSYFSIFLGRDDSGRSPSTLNEHVIDYTRAQICFAFISVLLMVMTIVAAFYTFKNSRYVYKRLASCLYFMTTITVLAVQEVLGTSVNYADGAKLYPQGSHVSYGFSYYLGWSVFLVYLVNGCMFLVMSRKVKYDDDDDIDGGQIMGR